MLDQLKDRRIVILGFGKEGQSTFRFLLKHGIMPAAVADARTQLLPQEQDLISQSDAEYIGGPGYLDAVDRFDLIFRSPGVPRLHPKLAEINGQKISSHTQLFLDLCPCPVIGVTGTKGKSTTASLIHHILKSVGKNSYLGGNIGLPPLEFLHELDRLSVAVLELSSFQTQDLKRSPKIGVILNVTRDHLDGQAYRPSSHASLSEYITAKAGMIAAQQPGDYAVLHPSLGKEFTQSGQGTKIIFNPLDAAGYATKLLGEHNLENIAAAAAACRALGLADEDIRAGIADFPGVPQRLQKVADKGGIAYVNDSASTNPDAAIAAIRAVAGPFVIILGGSDKGLDYSALAAELKNAPNLKGAVLIGELSEKLQALLAGVAAPVVLGKNNMLEVVKQARDLAQPGDTVLLSPGAASFGMFANSKDRGEQFNQAVEAI